MVIVYHDVGTFVIRKLDNKNTIVEIIWSLVLKTQMMNFQTSNETQMMKIKYQNTEPKGSVWDTKNKNTNREKILKKHKYCKESLV